MRLVDFLKRFISISSFLAPILIIFIPSTINLFWDLSLYSAFLLMCIRPFNDLFPNLNLRQYIVLRKHLGIFSSIIVVTFGLLHYIDMGSSFLVEYFSLSYWSFSGGLFFAHLGELTGFILLLTSNILSMRILKRNWKRVQRLSYVYFFSGALYVFIAFNKTFALISMIIVFELTLSAYLKKRMNFVE